MKAVDVLRERDPSGMDRLVELKSAGNSEKAWGWYCRNLYKTEDGIDLHLALYRWIYDLSEDDGFPAPAWIPDDETVEKANVTALCRKLKLDGPEELHRWSVRNRGDFWKLMTEKLGIGFEEAPSAILAPDSTPDQPRWFPGARMNIVANCFNAPPEQVAVLVGQEDGSLTPHSYGELRRMANRVANGLLQAGVTEGDRVAIIMPMTIEAVAVYLGTILSGGVIVSIADSFAAEEIAVRLRISDTKLIFTQNVIPRGGKEISLYARVREAGDWRAIVINVSGTKPANLCDGDQLWENFLGDAEEFEPVSRGPDDTVNILFSSGTTGSPKAIPWVQTTPLKCATDAFIHHDLQAGDVVCWPTNLGWMMGPWLIFATMLNRGTMALFDGLPQGSGFCRFVEKAKVTVLGVIPSLVRGWRESGVLETADWSAVRVFSSTGECSNPADMFHLMSRAGFRPVVEYCGGTELGGGYIAGTVVKPAAPATFTMAACGIDLVLVPEEGGAANKGEIFLSGPSVGLSTRLLNADHHAVYFADTPVDGDGKALRRHGDHLERLNDGSFRALGRHDDTMNLGGIKVGSAEIERAVATDPAVHEAAAIGSDDGGPSRLIVFVVPNVDSLTTEDDLKVRLQKAIRQRLNPLFKISEVHLVESLPRTASNKVMRRLLRSRIER